ncbi:hypothetical protein [Kitasatospora sp. NPDC059571]|uniref:hypothetical protein n=1 Tax=Kitasatospora sp. NPDC059571 TaxID=3346871 RepID=UPI0036A8AFE5
MTQFIDATVCFTESVDAGGKTFGGVQELKVSTSDGWLRVLDDTSDEQVIYTLPARNVAWIKAKPFGLVDSAKQLVEDLKAKTKSGGATP